METTSAQGFHLAGIAQDCLRSSWMLVNVVCNVIRLAGDDHPARLSRIMLGNGVHVQHPWKIKAVTTDWKALDRILNFMVRARQGMLIFESAVCFARTAIGFRATAF